MSSFHWVSFLSETSKLGQHEKVGFIEVKKKTKPKNKKHTCSCQKPWPLFLDLPPHIWETFTSECFTSSGRSRTEGTSRKMRIPAKAIVGVCEETDFIEASAIKCCIILKPVKRRELNHGNQISSNSTVTSHFDPWRLTSASYKLIIVNQYYFSLL